MENLLGKARDLSGQEFKYFKVIKFHKKFRDSTTRIYWECICKRCNSVCFLIGENILSNHSKSCGCLKRRGGQSNPNWRGCGDLSQDKFREIQRGAKIRGIDFKVSIEDLWNLFLKQDKKCALTSLDLQLNRNRHRCIRENASVDRIDNFKPYIIENVRWVHKDVNLMKNVLSDERLKELCKLILDKMSN